MNITIENMQIVRLPTPEEIRNLRVRAGLTQKKLAELAGVTQAYIAKIEKGQADPKLSTLQRILHAIESEISSSYPVTVGEIATQPVIYVRPTDTVKKSVELMERHNISQLPVIEGGKQIGAISETNLLKRVASGEKLNTLLNQRVSKIMGPPFPIVDRTTDIRRIYTMLEEHPAVLVTEREKIIGIITRADIFKLRRRMR